MQACVFLKISKSESVMEEKRHHLSLCFYILDTRYLEIWDKAPCNYEANILIHERVLTGRGNKTLACHSFRTQLGSGLQLAMRTFVGTFVSFTYTNADEKSDQSIILELVQVSENVVGRADHNCDHRCHDYRRAIRRCALRLASKNVWIYIYCTHISASLSHNSRRETCGLEFN